MANLSVQSASLARLSDLGRQIFTVSRNETVSFYSSAITTHTSIEVCVVTGCGLTLPSGVPASKNLVVQTGCDNTPGQVFNIKVRTRPDNFLHRADTNFHFWTKLISEDQHHFTFQKHFCWNIYREAHFHPDAAKAFFPASVISI